MRVLLVRKRWGRLISLLLLCALFAGCGFFGKEGKEKGRRDIVVATMNKMAITLEDLKREILEVRGFSATLEVEEASRGEIVKALKRLIRKALIVEEAGRIGIAVSDQELHDAVREIKQDYPEGSFEELLLKEGIKEKVWEEKLLKTLLIEKTSERIRKKAPPVSSRAVANYMKNNRIHLGKRISVPKKWHLLEYVFMSEEDVARAKLILGKTDGTRDRFVLEGAAIKGTLYDLGFMTEKELRGEYVKNLKDLKEKGISEIVKLPSSYAFFRVVKIVKKHHMSQWKAIRKIKAKLYVQKQDQYLADWLQKQFNLSRIKINEVALGKLESREE